MPVKKLKEFLDKNGIKYVSISHSQAFTAQEIAASAHISGRKLAKTVMVKLDDKMAMAVLGANHSVDFDQLARSARCTKAVLASEQDFRSLFPECEVGGMPPFGNLYDMTVYLDRGLAQEQEIAFNAGSHHELIRLSMADYQKLVKPTIAQIAKMD